MYQWAVQKALYEVAPWGERRQDLRTALQTANIIAAQSAEKIPDEAFGEMVRTMITYLKCEQDPEDTVDMDALARMKRKQ